MTLRHLVSELEYRPLTNFVIPLTLEGANELIGSALTKREPFMAGRLGSTELRTILRYRNLVNPSLVHRFASAFVHAEPPFWIRQRFQPIADKSGVFPVERGSIRDFCEIYESSAKEIDLLGSWIPGENKIFREENYPTGVCQLEHLEPFFADNPWTSQLSGQRVLVVHPFEDSIKRQFLRRKEIFPDSQLIPDFKLVTLKAEQTLGGNSSRVRSWAEGLDLMTDALEKLEFDSAIVGAGAYGLPIAARIKRMGVPVVHLGGATQLLFGIRGARWTNRPRYNSIMNDAWVSPSPDEKPVGWKGADGGAYWAGA